MHSSDVSETERAFCLELAQAISMLGERYDLHPIVVFALVARMMGGAAVSIPRRFPEGLTTENMRETLQANYDSAFAEAMKATTQ